MEPPLLPGCSASWQSTISSGEPVATPARSTSGGVRCPSTLVALDDRLVGFRAFGRYGELGTVVSTEQLEPGGSVLVVRGGVSEGLTYYVPVALVRTIVPEQRTMLVAADLTDFVPTLGADGTVELRVRS